jgi:hypothetical protein
MLTAVIKARFSANQAGGNGGSNACVAVGSGVARGWPDHDGLQQMRHPHMARRRLPGPPARLAAAARRYCALPIANKTPIKPTKPAKKAVPKPAAAKAANPRKISSKLPAPKPQSRKVAKPALLAGGNPQVAKGYGDAPVQAYIAAMPGWKRDVGRRLDALIVRTVPGLAKAVKWNSPFYGIEGQGEPQTWFLCFHCYTKYVKVAFFRGASLRPLPPAASKHKHVRYLDIHEHHPLDETQLGDWVKQASQLPGERM